jgi:hypothetical protein
MISVSPQTNIIIKRKPNAPESSTRSNPITQQRDSSFETMAKLKKLYQKLEIQINNIVLRRPNQKQEIQVTKETLNEIINFEKQFIANKKEPPEKNIPTSSTDVNLRRDFLLQALNSSLENLTPNWLKSIVVPLYSRLDPNNPEQSIEAVIELGNQSQEKLKKSNLLSQVLKQRQSLKDLEAYTTRSDKLKALVETIAEAQKLDYDKRIELVESLSILSSENPQFEKISEEYSDFKDRCQEFHRNVFQLAEVPGIAETINAAAKILAGRTDMSDFVNRVYGFFAEAKFNVALLNNNYQIEAIESMGLKGKPILVDHEGTDLLNGINLKDTPNAFEELNVRGLLDLDKGNGNLVRFKSSKGSSQVIYYDRQNGRLIFNKNSRTTNAPGVIVKQEDGTLSSFNADVIVSSKQNENLYLEHKINLSSFVNKISAQSTKTYNQLTNLLSVSKAHQVTPGLMISLEEIENDDGSINLNHPLLLKAQSLVQSLIKEKPELPRIRILDSQADDVTEYFYLGA